MRKATIRNKKKEIMEKTLDTELELVPSTLELDTIVEKLLVRRKELKGILEEITVYIALAPTGRLGLSTSNGCTQYHVKQNKEKGAGQYLSRKHIEFAKQLAQRDYYERIMKEIENELQSIERMLNLYNPKKLIEIHEHMSPRRKELITPIILSNEEYAGKWMTKEYHKKEVEEEKHGYVTERGEIVRSKSEVIIANMLDRMEIPYYYEFPVMLRGWGTVYADFYCLNVRNRKEYVWEHFGMIDNEEYANKAISKINHYIENHYFPGKNFIITLESLQQPLRTKVIEDSIRQYLL